MTKEKEYKPIILKMKQQPKIYWTTAKPFSYGKNAFLMYIIMGGRGKGKSTSLYIDVINNYLKNSEEFVILKRYKEETKKMYNVLDPVADNITTMGMGEGTFKFMNSGKRIGYGLTLSLQQTYKSNMDFSKVTTIIFDEAFLMPGSMLHYLPNEMEQLLELMSTIFRLRPNVRIFIVGNNMDMFNPYFAYYDIPYFDRIYTDYDRGIYCEKVLTQAQLKCLEEQSKLFKLTKGTPYADYHYNNQVLQVAKGTIGVKGLYAKLLCRLLYEKHTLNIYLDNNLSCYVEHRDKIIKDDLTYEIRNETKLNYFQVKQLRSTSTFRFIEKTYYANNISYNDQEAIGIMQVIMQEVSTRKKMD